MSQYVVHVFGKEGCAKCTMLNRRLDDLLSKEPYRAIRQQLMICDRRMCGIPLAQCVNPNRFLRWSLQI